jgi:hypothetical protein
VDNATPGREAKLDIYSDLLIAPKRFARTFSAMHRILIFFAWALIGQAALQINGVTPSLGSGTVVPEGETQSFSITASSDRSILYRWFLDDNELLTETASSYSYSPGFDSIIHVDLAPLERPVAVRCEVRTDQDSAQTLTWNITLQDTNRAPVVLGSVTVTPSARAGINDNLVCTVAGDGVVDPDPEDNVQLMYLWTSGSKSALSCPVGSNVDILNTALTVAGEVWTCNVTGIDPLGLRSTTGVEDSVTINTPPTVTNILLREDHGRETLSFFPGNSIEAEPSGSDVDGDALTFAYTWLRDGDDSGITESVLSLDESVFSFRDEVTLVVNAIDAWDIGPPLQITTTLGWLFRFDWVSPNCDDLAIGQHGSANDGVDALDILSDPGDTASLLPGRPGNFGSPHTVDLRALGDVSWWTLSLKAGQSISWNMQAGVPGSSLIMYEIDRHGYLLGSTIDLLSAEVIVASAQDRHFIIRLSEQQTAIATWEAGWNLISSPVRLPQTAMDEVFATFDPAGLPLIFDWDGIALSSAAEIANQHGYWAYLPVAAQIPFHGSQAVQNILDLATGWNLIAVSLPVAAPGFSQRCSPFWRWDIELQDYRAAAELHPGHGYWINSKSPITLNLTP